MQFYSLNLTETHIPSQTARLAVDWILAVGLYPAQQRNSPSALPIGQPYEKESASVLPESNCAKIINMIVKGCSFKCIGNAVFDATWGRCQDISHTERR